ncbi:hypothetical protein IWX78_001706 [Mycetocola sp. CAN_C7]|uniref:DUF1801 domain-containing protein n=1 Tax=Mycetocola sp. CAN_C7 TaxID=2787724 RepID=UPI0018CA805A
MSRQDTDAYLSSSDQPLVGALAELCDLIRAVDPRIVESIKWNAPSFAISDHFATTGFAPSGALRLVLHTGAVKRAVPLVVEIEDAGLSLDWKGTDRAVVTFGSADEVGARDDALRSVLRQWIAQTQA